MKERGNASVARERAARRGLTRRATMSLLIVVLVLAALVEVAVGPIMMSPGKVVSETFAYFAGAQTPDAVVMGAIRLPRMVAAAVVGAGLASTGAALQAVFRNPMADPAIIGVSSGGALGAVLVIQLGLAAVSPWWTPVGAFAAGLLTVYIIYKIATVGGRTAIYSLLLSGVAISSFCGAMVSFVLSLAPTETMQEMLFWLMGGLDGITWPSVWMVGAFTAAGMAVYGLYGSALDILSIGEEQAEGVGVNLQQVKRVMFITAAFVVGACVSVSGIIAFVGLIVPHLMRLILGPRHRYLLPASAIGGAILVLLSDIVARLILLPAELNVGIVTASLGAPFFLYLLRRRATSFERR